MIQWPFNRRTLLLCILLTTYTLTNAQYYVAFMPAFYTSAGSTGQRFTWDLEVGKQWDVFSIGLDVGKTNLAPKAPRDTTWYVGARTNLNVFQQRRFTNTLTIGIGYVFQAKMNVMAETTTGVEYTINDQYHFNLFFGTYFFSGRNASDNRNFFGLSLVRFFVPKKERKKETP